MLLGFLRFARRARVLAQVVLLTVCAVRPLAAAPVTFEFSPPQRRGVESPFAREIFADVLTPAGASLRLPAYFAGRDRWIVRARADQPGEYRLARVIEQRAGVDEPLVVRHRIPPIAVVERATPLPPVGRAAGDPTRLAFADGAIYTPIGANLAWAAGGRVTWHVDALQQFAAEQLNWTRIWMCHWGATNLDWLPDAMGRSPKPGHLDARIAENWDRILEAAEAHGVYVQLVLQHHGQYTTGANANWAINPWNAAHRGGFLATPGDFFTSQRAKALTKQKYRYIIARWSHTPAILAWELFNEVHWTNAYRDDGNEAAVAAWHAEMAAYIRSIDPYRHLVTTSLDDLHSPIYAAMDYYQPHLYAINMLTGVREFEHPFATFDRPVFFGEIGDDKMPVSPAEKAGGSQLIPQVWASLMGPGPNPGQSWLGETFLHTRRLGELGAVARFLRETGLATRTGLSPFAPPVLPRETTPLVIVPGYDWARHREGSVTLPLDGSDSLALNHIPGILVGSPRSVAEGYLREFTLDLTLPQATSATVEFADGGARGASATVLVDDTVVGSHTWPALPGAPAFGPQPEGTPQRPASLTFNLPAGPHRLVLRNTGNLDWIQLGRIRLDLESPLIAAAGKRSDDFIALWVWNKTGVHALAPTAAASATVVVPDVPAGDWITVWWDADRGVPGERTRVHHPGGTLALPTPPITRHAAVVLTR